MLPGQSAEFSGKPQLQQGFGDRAARSPTVFCDEPACGGAVIQTRAVHSLVLRSTSKVACDLFNT